MVDDTIKQTRCSTCDFEHPYKEAKVPARRKKKDATSALFQQVLDNVTEGMKPPATATAASDATRTTPARRPRRSQSAPRSGGRRIRCPAKPRRKRRRLPRRAAAPRRKPPPLPPPRPRRCSRPNPTRRRPPRSPPRPRPSAHRQPHRERPRWRRQPPRRATSLPRLARRITAAASAASVQPPARRHRAGCAPRHAREDARARRRPPHARPHRRSTARHHRPRPPRWSPAPRGVLRPAAPRDHARHAGAANQPPAMAASPAAPDDAEQRAGAGQRRRRAAASPRAHSRDASASCRRSARQGDSHLHHSRGRGRASQQVPAQGTSERRGASGPCADRADEHGQQSGASGQHPRTAGPRRRREEGGRPSAASRGRASALARSKGPQGGGGKRFK